MAGPHLYVGGVDVSQQLVRVPVVLETPAHYNTAGCSLFTAALTFFKYLNRDVKFSFVLCFHNNFLKCDLSHCYTYNQL